MPNLKMALELKNKIEFLGGKLIAVSKKFPASDIELIHSLGIEDFGENYVSEAIEKIYLLEKLNLRWHFIGRVQTGNLNKIIDRFHLIHSLYKMSHLEKINERSKKRQKVLLQLHHSKDQRGFGLSDTDVLDIVEKAIKLDRIDLSGLMFMPPAEFDLIAIKNSFEWATSVFSKIKKQMPDSHAWDTLSMGMSGDFEQALKAGSTHVRIGTAVFGKRS